MTEAVDRIVKALPEGGGRCLIAIAGPPASGKSTLAEALVDRLGPDAALVPMDGFHLDNDVLDARGLRPRKGAPETFDAAGFVALIRRLKTGGEVIAPVFDRTRDISVAGARVVPAEAGIIVVEGNYLLFDDDAWRGLAELWDLSVFLDVADSVLEERLIRRWLDHGHGEAAARERALGNDIPNARRVNAERLPADLVITG